MYTTVCNPRFFVKLQTVALLAPHKQPCIDLLRPFASTYRRQASKQISNVVARYSTFALKIKA